ncbi:MAG: tRNA 2-thiouridine(34) synthase MnmA [Mycoplasma sp.]|nr:tRNA 2-thiouridine(34) synthase MnmA [Mycoplasma sp.]
MKKTKRVIVGMSGGVDSAISAYLLKKEGYDVVGLFMRNWDSMLNNDILGNENIDQNICPQEKDYQDALEASKIIGIELKRIDFIQEYWDYVFENFIQEYAKGRTPNPDILCNKFIKFDKMLNHALNELNGDYLATGHYAKLIDGKLYKADDKEKDQSYFLAQLTPEQLKNTLFPLSKYKKTQIREIAKKINLNIANKKDSTGICFIGERDFDKFLQNYIPAKPGKIIDIETGKEIGKHYGVMYYTIGQRKGLNLGGMKEPYFLAAKNIKNKELFAAPLSKEKHYLSSNKLIGIDLNLNTNDFDINNLHAKFRYRQNDQKIFNVNIDYDKKTIMVEYDSQLAVTPGQHIVIYDNEKCIGGATIDKIFLNDNELDLLNYKI